MLRTGSNDSQSRENCNQKIHPQPADEMVNDNRISVEDMISKFFNRISSLKSAYVQLQRAHTPYDPDKIQTAGKLVIEELVNLSELKHKYRDHNPKPASSSPQDACLAVEIQEQQNLLKTYEVTVKKFQSQIQNRDSEILQLQNQIKESIQKKSKLEQKLKQRGLLARDQEEPKGQQSFFSVELTPDLFSSVVDEVHKSIHDFAKPLINMMKTAKWDLDAAADSIAPGVCYAKRSHKKYAFESHICRRMFVGFHEESFTVESGASVNNSNEGFFNMQFLSVRSMDPLEVLTQNPDSVFGKFCRMKYLLVVHPKMEGSFFGNLDQRNHVTSGGHPRTPFYTAFLKLSKSVWLLHRLAHSFDPKVKVYQVKMGNDFSEVYMESIIKNVVLDIEQKPKVMLMVMPGFIVGGGVLQSRVYLSGVKCTD